MQKIKTENLKDNSVLRIILNDPKGNVLDGIMMQELSRLFGDLRKRPEVKAITFEGEGAHFSFGASVEEHKKEFAAKMISSFHGLFYDIMDLSIPAIAKISGQCLGGGLELALICNFMFADRTAKLGQPEIILGVFPPPASVMLPMKIGSSAAEDLILTGRTVTAEEAKAMGIVNEVYEDRNTMDAAVDLFLETQILPKSASSLRYAVRSSRSSFYDTLRKILPKLEEVYSKELMETHDANEGINSFLEKRKPVWKNK